MSPIQLLRDGIINGDWGMVCAAYNGLTGETLERPSDDNGRAVSALREIIKMASAGLGDCGTPSPSSTLILPGQTNPAPVLLPSVLSVRSVTSAAPPDGKDDPDFIMKTDIDGPGPEEPTVEQQGEPNVYGVPVTVITQDGASIKPGEVQRNERKAAAAAARKENRPAPTTWKAVCSVCEREFDSLRKPSTDIGQRCPKCIKDLAASRGRD